MHIVKRDVLFIIFSLIIQIPLAFALGHYYDDRIFMTTGYLVNSGFSPYQPADLSMIFMHPSFGGVIPSIGYPPPWPLLLGAIYHLSYGISSNIFLYNFAIKIPIIVCNIILAYALKCLLLRANVSRKNAQFAWLFILFNPFILLTSTAWGAFDTVIGLLTVAAIYFLSVGKTKFSASLLAVSLATKPIALPIIGLPILFLTLKNSKKPLMNYLLVFSSIFLICFFVPFILFGWGFNFGSGSWNAHFIMAGGMSPFNIIELFSGSQVFPSGFWILGFLWVPALCVGYFFTLHNRPNSRDDLIRLSIVLIFVFFLTRSWLSEPNINLILPMMLLLIGDEKKTFFNFHFIWVMPLFFMFFNFSFPQLFFLPYPSILESLSVFDQQFGNIRLLFRFLLAIIWQVLAWRLIFRLNKNQV